MKKIILSVVALLITIVSFAQVNADNSAHLVFKGVPINGTLSDYVAKMLSGGFTLTKKEGETPLKNGIAVLKGDFAGYKNCKIQVSTLKQKDLVANISVEFPKAETWSVLSLNYFSLKELLSEKYGKPSQNVEKFDNDYPSQSDMTKFSNVRMDRCKYYSIYQTEKGVIKLSISHDSFMNCFVELTYQDKVNSAVIKTEALSDL